jgi:hypothetical protein
MQYASLSSQPAPELADLGTSPLFERPEGVVPLAYAASVTTDLRKGTYFTVDITDGNGWTLENPVDSAQVYVPENVMLVGEIALEIRNAAVDAPGAIALGSMWKLAGPILPPEAGTRKVVRAVFNGTDMVESATRVTDIPYP